MEPVELFYSYSHEDEPFRDELAGHLKILERKGLIRPWHDRRIVPGQDWDAEIDQQLAAADLILLLVSSDFISSDYIWGHELATAMRRHESGEAAVVPVLVRDCLMEDAPFAKIQGLPTDLRPVTSWPNRDEAWTDVAKGIRKTVLAIQQRAEARPADMPAGIPQPASALPAELSPATLQRSANHRAELRFGFDASPAMPIPTEVLEQLRATAPDLVLNGVIDGSVRQLTRAASQRGTTIDPEQAGRSALQLIDSPEQKRVLWVDDRPENNLHEMAALSKLQVEVVTARSTEEALHTIAGDTEGFDLVISDWQRPEPTSLAQSAGIRLLRSLRAVNRTIPVVFYHGEFDAKRRQVRHDAALLEGALGEAVLPDELFGLVTQALVG